MFISPSILLSATSVSICDLDSLGVECLTIKDLLDEFEPYPPETDTFGNI